MQVTGEAHACCMHAAHTSQKDPKVHTRMHTAPPPPPTHSFTCHQSVVTSMVFVVAH